MDITVNTMPIAQGERLGFFAKLMLGWRRSVVQRTTYNELDSLSDRELADIGMTRGEISEVAAQGASLIK